MERFEQFVDLDEQETYITMDYATKEMFVYSNRATVMNRMLKSGYQPTELYYEQENVCGAVWVFPISMIGKFARTGIFGYTTSQGK